MIASGFLVVAAQASDVASGAWLTLVLPVALTVVAFVVLYFLLRRALLTPAPRAAASPHVETKATAPGS